MSESDSDSELLARFAAERCEEAFTALVRRHLGLVHAAALRRVRSPQLAEDIAQSVFLDLAQNAHRLAPGTVLAAWLYQVTQRTAVDAIRRETRRQLREQTALEMNALDSAPDDWTRIAPLLEDAMQALDGPDREAILLRFFHNQPLREVGAALGISEDAAQKRIRRAMDRLRERLAGRNISVASGGLAALLSSHAAPTASDALITRIANSALLGVPRVPTRPGLAAAWIAGLRGLLPTGMATKLAVGGLALAVVAGLAWLAVARRELQPPAHAGQPVPEAAAAEPAAAPDARAPESAGSVAPLPDPRELLLAVARARQQLASGIAEFTITTAITGQKSGRDETNEVQATLLFDGNRLRVEQTNREYSYAYSDNEAEQEAIRKRADAMDRESAVREGLLKPFLSRHVTVTDQHVMMDLWDTGSGHPTVTLEDPRGGSTVPLFDPRCLGLASYVGPHTTVEPILGISSAKSVELLGQEIMDGTGTWHVRVQLAGPQDSLVALDFWLEAARPDRVLRHSINGDVVTSRYDASDPGNPIPVEVQVVDGRTDGLRMSKRIVRIRSDWNAPVDSRQFTLAGLGMPVGTPVTDVRKHRRMGYWTGTGLSEDLPETSAEESPVVPDLAELMALLEFSPASEEARDAAIWIVLNNPDGPEVERAFEVLRAHHTRAPGLLTLCREQERVRHRGSRAFLEILLREHPEFEVRGTACFALALMLKDGAKFGQNAQATTAALQLLERATAEFGTVRWQGNPLRIAALPELDDLRRLGVGQPAPEIVGQDLEGEAMRLSDHRGRVVVLVFWSEGLIQANELRKLAELFKDEPFSVVGVFCDKDVEAARSEVQRRDIPWRSFLDGHNGPISKEWNIRSWPTIWVLDRQGIIRHRDVWDSELPQAVQRLLKE